MMPRKVCAVITARPSYSRIRSGLEAIRDHPGVELQLVVAASAAEVEPEHAMDQQCQPSLPTAQSSGPYLLAFAWTFGAEALEAHPHRAGAPSVDPS